MPQQLTEEQIFLTQLMNARGFANLRFEPVYDILQVNAVGSTVDYGDGANNVVFFVHMSISATGAQPVLVETKYTNPLVQNAFVTPNNFSVFEYAGNNTTLYTIPTPFVVFQSLTVTGTFGSGARVNIQGWKVYFS